MVRWLLLLLVAATAGCALVDDYDDVQPMVYERPVVVSQPAATCGPPIVPASYNQTQTSEPPR